jgi:N-acetylglucosamine-6-phosphate deacetylase
MPPLLCFTNCQTCVSGELIPQDVYFSPEQGIIVPNYYYRTEGVNRIDLGGAIVAPGFLELQTNGLRGVHFTQLGEKGDDEPRLLKVAQSQIQCGVTAFWCTIPTVEEGSWGKVRPLPFPKRPDVLVSSSSGPYFRVCCGKVTRGYTQQERETPSILKTHLCNISPARAGSRVAFMWFDR